ncbi:hypothetical protein K5V21_04045 [Clostridium sardiniense]|uniref:IgA-specific metalloendopeptidase n=1 Tax=Clostridium sardiniense TaxID=29369 RepID=A0ABS7KV68_CLOSR|nr:ZmpA/ZmpB/ZmpC family metallo-endopeptidase [Clostridium sardiniense]MBY0754624.1 hypothetical protein [Clostridium sardiniense]MDQ0460774.1 hypothetical protein [Clostridium sardiniense]
MRNIIKKLGKKDHSKLIFVAVAILILITSIFTGHNYSIKKVASATNIVTENEEKNTSENSIDKNSDSISKESSNNIKVDRGNESSTKSDADNSNTIKTIKESKQSENDNRSINKDTKEESNGIVTKIGYNSNALNNTTKDDNKIENQELLNEEVHTVKKRIELKDIVGIQLYKDNNGTIETIDLVDIKDKLNLNEYFVEIKLKDMPILKAPLKGYKVTNNELEFEVDFPNLVQVSNDGTKTDGFKFKYNSKDNKNNINIENIQGLKAVINSNPSAEIELSKDIDAGYYTDGESIITEAFTGKINGNGFKIYNLKLPLFKEIKNATINGLILDDVNIETNKTQVGALAKVSSKSDITNTHVIGKISGADTVGGLIGKDDGSYISKSSVDANIVVSNGNVGEFIGIKSSGGDIKDSYALGSITASPSSTSNKAGGIVGQITGGTILNSFSAVNINSTVSNRQVGGLIGSTYTSGNSLNNISFGNVTNGLKVDGDRNYLGRHRNVYEYKEAKGISIEDLSSKPSGINIATKENKENKDFYINTLKWDSNTWDLSKVSEGEYPTLKNNDPRNKKQSNESLGETLSSGDIKVVNDIAKKNGLNIPNLDRISKFKDFNKDKLIAYHNVYKLMPYYESEYIVSYGNTISKDNELNKKVIKSIEPLNSGKVKLNITTENYKDIDEIMVIYEDGAIKKFKVALGTEVLESSIVNYLINGTSLIYNPSSFITKGNSEVINELKALIESKSFDDILSIIGGRNIQKDALWTDSKTSHDLDWYMLDKDYNKVKKNSVENLYSIMTAVDDWNITSSNALINRKIKEDIEKNLNYILLSKSYIDRWYDIKIGDIKLNDIMYIYPKTQSNTSTKKLIDTFKNISKDDLKTNRTQIFYKNYLSNLYGKETVEKFIEKNIKIFDGSDSPSKWLVKNFSGKIIEKPSKKYPNLRYTAWDGLVSNTQAGDGAFLLPALTLKEDSIYIISTVGTIAFGNRSSYTADEGEYLRLLNETASWYENYYNSVTYVSNNVDKNMRQFPAWDTPKLSNGAWINLLDESNEGSEGFYKPLRMLTGPKNNGSAAFANGYWVTYVHARNLGGEYPFSVWTHENAHDQDGRIILDGQGRRNGLGAEDFATGLFQYEAYNGLIGMNWAINKDEKGSGFLNKSPERLNSKENMQSFMKGLMDAVYTLDLAEAEALLEMPVEKQSELLWKYEYGKVDGTSDKSFKHYRKVTVDEIKGMNLKTIADLINNKLVIERDSRLNTDIRPNDYGGSNVLSASYYHGVNENGRADNVSIKRMAFELLADKGWTDGFIPFLTNRDGYKNDLDALKGIYNNKSLNFESWKLGLYKEREEEIKNKGVSILSKEKIKDMFKEAYKLDNANNKNASKQVREKVYKLMKNSTDDFNKSIFGTSNISGKIKTSEEFILKINNNPEGVYYLENDIDFSKVEASESVVNEFRGFIQGRGHRIIGLKTPLFKTLKGADVTSLIIEGANIDMKSTDRVGALSGDSINSKIEDVHVVNSSIVGKTTVGALIGFDRSGTIIKKVSANASVESLGRFAGGIAGAKYGGSIENSYSLGTIKGKSDYVGGLIGDSRTTISNSYSGANVSGGTLTGGFIGVAENQAVGQIKNNLSIGNSSNYKFVSNNLKDRLTNNYEFEGSAGKANAIETYVGKIDVASEADLNDKTFYTDKLLWKETVWDLSNVNKGYYPKLKNSDINSVIRK